MSGTEKYACSDVGNMELPMKGVQEARKEDMTHMKENTFMVVMRAEAFERTGKPPISTKWVNTDKSQGVGNMNVRSRWVARDFKTDGKQRKTMVTDVKEAHLVPRESDECRKARALALWMPPRGTSSEGSPLKCSMNVGF